jgi:hypothetical protein
MEFSYSCKQTKEITHLLLKSQYGKNEYCNICHWDETFAEVKPRIEGGDLKELPAHLCPPPLKYVTSRDRSLSVSEI